MTLLNDILCETERKIAATNAGTRMHVRMAHAPNDAELMQRVAAVPGLAEFFAAGSDTEVPIAGFIHGKFISRRIDRMCIDDNTKSVAILDYKTDTDKSARRGEYVAQLREYVTLLKQIYPEYKISAHILWMHDWQLERIM